MALYSDDEKATAQKEQTQKQIDENIASYRETIAKLTETYNSLVPQKEEKDKEIAAVQAKIAERKEKLPPLKTAYRRTRDLSQAAETAFLKASTEENEAAYESAKSQAADAKAAMDEAKALLNELEKENSILKKSRKKITDAADKARISIKVFEDSIRYLLTASKRQEWVLNHITEYNVKTKSAALFTKPNGQTVVLPANLPILEGVFITLYQREDGSIYLEDNGNLYGKSLALIRTAPGPIEENEKAFAEGFPHVAEIAGFEYDNWRVKKNIPNFTSFNKDKLIRENASLLYYELAQFLNGFFPK